MAQGHERATVNATGCGFESQGKDRPRVPSAIQHALLSEFGETISVGNGSFLMRMECLNTTLLRAGCGREIFFDIFYVPIIAGKYFFTFLFVCCLYLFSFYVTAMKKRGL